MTTWTNINKTAINHERFLESGDIRITEGGNIRTLEDGSMWWNDGTKNTSIWSQNSKNTTVWASPTKS